MQELFHFNWHVLLASASQPHCAYLLT